MPPKQKKDKKLSPLHLCVNIKNRKHPNERCIYPAKKGEFCSRHWKNPCRYELASVPALATRSISGAIRKIQKWWRLKHGLQYIRERSLAFFARDLCHNDRELATFESLDTIPRDYFFVVKQHDKFWGFDIRTLLVQYEASGKLENAYTTETCNAKTLEAFRTRLDRLRRWKKPLAFEQLSGLSTKQSWNLRVLDVCLRLDMLGYRIATNWFSDLDIGQQRTLYSTLFSLWSEQLQLTEAQKLRIVPEYTNPMNRLFRWSPEKIAMKHDLDSIRRTNINIIERLISSAQQPSDKTLGAMYTVMGLCTISNRCREAYPWLA